MRTTDAHATRVSRPEPFVPASPSTNRDGSASVAESRISGRRVKPEKSLRSRAIGYLSRREHSRAELAAKLAAFASEEDDDAIDPLLDALEREGWLSDQRYADSLLNRRASRFGSQRILSELRRGKIDESLIQQSAERLADSEYRRAYEVWQKRFVRVGAPDSPQARAKQMRFLLSRGFSAAIAAKVLRSVGADDAFECFPED